MIVLPMSPCLRNPAKFLLKEYVNAVEERFFLLLLYIVLSCLKKRINDQCLDLTLCTWANDELMWPAIFMLFINQMSHAIVFDDMISAYQDH